MTLQNYNVIILYYVNNIIIVILKDLYSTMKFGCLKSVIVQKSVLQSFLVPMKFLWLLIMSTHNYTEI